MFAAKELSSLREIYSRLAHYTVAVTILLATLLSGCDGSGCIYADDWGDRVNLNLTIPADRALTNTSVTVRAGEPLFMRVSGMVDLCPDNLTMGPTTSPFSITAASDQWQNSGYRVAEGDVVGVLVDGGYNDRSGRVTDGKGLYMLIAEAVDGTNNTEPEVAGVNDDWWYGLPNATTVNTEQLKRAETDPAAGNQNGAPNFVELWNNGTVGRAGGFMGEVPENTEGYIWFKYARTANPESGSPDGRRVNDSGDWGDRWSPWKGFWSSSHPECHLCTPEQITLTCHIVAAINAAIGDPFFAAVRYATGYAVCTAAWILDCDGQERSPGQRYCRDMPAALNNSGTDAWCGDPYGGGGGQSGCFSWPANQGGYDITIGAGCPGSMGKYLFAYFANGNQDTPIRTQRFEPAGCSPADRANCHPVFSGGRPVHSETPNLLGTTPNFSMDYRVNSDFTSEGEIIDDYTAPFTGRLWFKLQDNEVKPSDLVTMQRTSATDPWTSADCTSSGTNCCIDPPECVDNPFLTIVTRDGTAQRPQCNSAANTGFTRLGLDTSGNETGNCRPARGYVGYADNIGSYDVNVETTKISTNYSAFLTGLINSVRGILFGECMSGGNLANRACFTQGYCMDGRTDAQKCRGDFSGTYVPGVGCTNATSGVLHSNLLRAPACATGTARHRSPVDLRYYCVIPQRYTVAICDKNTDMILSGNECVYDTRVTSGECESYSGRWVPTRSDWRPGITQRMYNKFIMNADQQGTNTVNPFLNAVRAAILLYIITFALFYMLGTMETPQKDFVVALFRVIIILILISPGSWDFFHRYLFAIFTDGMGELISTVSGQFMGVMNNVGDNFLVDPITGNQVLDPTGAVAPAMVDASGNALLDANGDVIRGIVTEAQMRPVQVGVEDPFSFVNQTLGMFFSPEVHKKLFGLFFSSFPLGIFFVLFIWWGMMIYVLTVIKAAVLYIMAMLSISLLLIVAPVFLSFMLFERTRGIFEKWIFSLINFLFQPVMVLTALALFNVFVYSALYLVLHFDVCWGCLLHVKWDILPSMNIEFCVFWGYKTWGSSEGSGEIPMGFYLILSMVIMTNIAYQMNDWVSKMVAGITAGDGSTALSKISGNIVGQMKAGIGSALSAGKNKAKGRMKQASEDKKDKSGSGSKGGSTKR